MSKSKPIEEVVDRLTATYQSGASALEAIHVSQEGGRTRLVRRGGVYDVRTVKGGWDRLLLFLESLFTKLQFFRVEKRFGADLARDVRVIRNSLKEYNEDWICHVYQRVEAESGPVAASIAMAKEYESYYKARERVDELARQIARLIHDGQGRSEITQADYTVLDEFGRLGAGSDPLQAEDFSDLRLLVDDEILRGQSPTKWIGTGISIKLKECKSSIVNDIKRLVLEKTLSPLQVLDFGRLLDRARIKRGFATIAEALGQSIGEWVDFALTRGEGQELVRQAMVRIVESAELQKMLVDYVESLRPQYPTIAKEVEVIADTLGGALFEAYGRLTEEMSSIKDERLPAAERVSEIAADRLEAAVAALEDEGPVLEAEIRAQRLEQEAAIAAALSLDPEALPPGRIQEVIRNPSSSEMRTLLLDPTGLSDRAQALAEEHTREVENLNWVFHRLAQIVKSSLGIEDGSDVHLRAAGAKLEAGSFNTADSTWMVVAAAAVLGISSVDGASYSLAEIPEGVEKLALFPLLKLAIAARDQMTHVEDVKGERDEAFQAVQEEMSQLMDLQVSYPAFRKVMRAAGLCQAAAAKEARSRARLSSSKQRVRQAAEERRVFETTAGELDRKAEMLLEVRARLARFAPKA